MNFNHLISVRSKKYHWLAIIKQLLSVYKRLLMLSQYKPVGRLIALDSTKLIKLQRFNCINFNSSSKFTIRKLNRVLLIKFFNSHITNNRQFYSKRITWIELPVLENSLQLIIWFAVMKKY